MMSIEKKSIKHVEEEKSSVVEEIVSGKVMSSTKSTADTDATNSLPTAMERITKDESSLDDVVTGVPIVVALPQQFLPGVQELVATTLQVVETSTGVEIPFEHIDAGVIVLPSAQGGMMSMRCPRIGPFITNSDLHCTAVSPLDDAPDQRISLTDLMDDDVSIDMSLSEFESPGVAALAIAEPVSLDPSVAVSLIREFDSPDSMLTEADVRPIPLAIAEPIHRVMNVANPPVTNSDMLREGEVEVDSAFVGLLRETFSHHSFDGVTNRETTISSSDCVNHIVADAQSAKREAMKLSMSDYAPTTKKTVPLRATALSKLPRRSGPGGATASTSTQFPGPEGLHDGLGIPSESELLPPRVPQDRVVREGVRIMAYVKDHELQRAVEEETERAAVRRMAAFGPEPSVPQVVYPVSSPSDQPPPILLPAVSSILRVSASSAAERGVASTALPNREPVRTVGLSIACATETNPTVTRPMDPPAVTIGVPIEMGKGLFNHGVSQPPPAIQVPTGALHKRAAAYVNPKSVQCVRAADEDRLKGLERGIRLLSHEMEAPVAIVLNALAVCDDVQLRAGDVGDPIKQGVEESITIGMALTAEVHVRSVDPQVSPASIVGLVDEGTNSRSDEMQDINHESLSTEQEETIQVRGSGRVTTATAKGMEYQQARVKQSLRVTPVRKEREVFEPIAAPLMAVAALSHRNSSTRGGYGTEATEKVFADFIAGNGEKENSQAGLPSDDEEGSIPAPESDCEYGSAAGEEESDAGTQCTEERYAEWQECNESIGQAGRSSTQEGLSQFLREDGRDNTTAMDVYQSEHSEAPMDYDYDLDGDSGMQMDTEYSVGLDIEDSSGTRGQRNKSSTDTASQSAGASQSNSARRQTVTKSGNRTSVSGSGGGSGGSASSSGGAGGEEPPKPPTGGDKGARDVTKSKKTVSKTKTESDTDSSEEEDDEIEEMEVDASQTPSSTETQEANPGASSSAASNLQSSQSVTGAVSGMTIDTASGLVTYTEDVADYELESPPLGPTGETTGIGQGDTSTTVSGQPNHSVSAVNGTASSSIHSGISQLTRNERDNIYLNVTTAPPGTMVYASLGATTRNGMEEEQQEADEDHTDRMTARNFMEAHLAPDSEERRIYFDRRYPAGFLPLDELINLVTLMQHELEGTNTSGITVLETLRNHQLEYEAYTDADWQRLVGRTALPWPRVDEGLEVQNMISYLGNNTTLRYATEGLRPLSESEYFRDFWYSRRGIGRQTRAELRAREDRQARIAKYIDVDQVRERQRRDDLTFDHASTFAFWFNWVNMMDNPDMAEPVYIYRFEPRHFFYVIEGLERYGIPYRMYDEQVFELVTRVTSGTPETQRPYEVSLRVLEALDSSINGPNQLWGQGRPRLDAGMARDAAAMLGSNSPPPADMEEEEEEETVNFDEAVDPNATTPKKKRCRNRRHRKRGAHKQGNSCNNSQSNSRNPSRETSPERNRNVNPWTGSSNNSGPVIPPARPRPGDGIDPEHAQATRRKYVRAANEHEHEYYRRVVRGEHKELKEKETEEQRMGTYLGTLQREINDNLNNIETHRAAIASARTNARLANRAETAYERTRRLDDENHINSFQDNIRRKQIKFDGTVCLLNNLRHYLAKVKTGIHHYLDRMQEALVREGEDVSSAMNEFGGTRAPRGESLNESIGHAHSLRNQQAEVVTNDQQLARVGSSQPPVRPGRNFPNTGAWHNTAAFDGVHTTGDVDRGYDEVGGSYNQFGASTEGSLIEGTPVSYRVPPVAPVRREPPPSMSADRNMHGKRSGRNESPPNQPASKRSHNDDEDQAQGMADNMPTDDTPDDGVNPELDETLVMALNNPTQLNDRQHDLLEVYGEYSMSVSQEAVGVEHALHWQHERLGRLEAVRNRLLTMEIAMPLTRPPQLRPYRTRPWEDVRRELQHIFHMRHFVVMQNNRPFRTQLPPSNTWDIIRAVSPGIYEDGLGVHLTLEEVQHEAVFQYTVAGQEGRAHPRNYYRRRVSMYSNVRQEVADLEAAAYHRRYVDNPNVVNHGNQPPGGNNGSGGYSGGNNNYRGGNNQGSSNSGYRQNNNHYGSHEKGSNNGNGQHSHKRGNNRGDVVDMSDDDEYIAQSVMDDAEYARSVQQEEYEKEPDMPDSSSHSNKRARIHTQAAGNQSQKIIVADKRSDAGPSAIDRAIIMERNHLYPAMTHLKYSPFIFPQDLAITQLERRDGFATEHLTGRVDPKLLPIGNQSGTAPIAVQPYMCYMYNNKERIFVNGLGLQMSAETFRTLVKLGKLDSSGNVYWLSRSKVITSEDEALVDRYFRTKPQFHAGLHQSDGVNRHVLIHPSFEEDAGHDVEFYPQGMQVFLNTCTQELWDRFMLRWERQRIANIKCDECELTQSAPGQWSIEEWNRRVPPGPRGNDVTSRKPKPSSSSNAPQSPMPTQNSKRGESDIRQYTSERGYRQFRKDPLRFSRTDKGGNVTVREREDYYSDEDIVDSDGDVIPPLLPINPRDDPEEFVTDSDTDEHGNRSSVITLQPSPVRKAPFNKIAGTKPSITVETLSDMEKRGIRLPVPKNKAEYDKFIKESTLTAAAARQRNAEHLQRKYAENWEEFMRESQPYEHKLSEANGRLEDLKKKMAKLMEKQTQQNKSIIYQRELHRVMADYRGQLAAEKACILGAHAAIDKAREIQEQRDRQLAIEMEEDQIREHVQLQELEQLIDSNEEEGGITMYGDDLCDEQPDPFLDEDAPITVHLNSAKLKQNGKVSATVSRGKSASSSSTARPSSSSANAGPSGSSWNARPPSSSSKVVSSSSSANARHSASSSAVPAALRMSRQQDIPMDSDDDDVIPPTPSRTTPIQDTDTLVDEADDVAEESVADSDEDIVDSDQDTQGTEESDYEDRETKWPDPVTQKKEYEARKTAVEEIRKRWPDISPAGTIREIQERFEGIYLEEADKAIRSGKGIFLMKPAMRCALGYMWRYAANGTFLPSANVADKQEEMLSHIMEVRHLCADSQDPEGYSVFFLDEWKAPIESSPTPRKRKPAASDDEEEGDDSNSDFTTLSKKGRLIYVGVKRTKERADEMSLEDRRYGLIINSETLIDASDVIEHGYAKGRLSITALINTNRHDTSLNNMYFVSPTKNIVGEIGVLKFEQGKEVTIQYSSNQGTARGYDMTYAKLHLIRILASHEMYMLDLQLQDVGKRREVTQQVIHYTNEMDMRTYITLLNMPYRDVKATKKTVVKRVRRLISIIEYRLEQDEPEVYMNNDIYGISEIHFPEQLAFIKEYREAMCFTHWRDHRRAPFDIRRYKPALQHMMKTKCLVRSLAAFEKEKGIVWNPEPVIIRVNQVTCESVDSGSDDEYNADPPIHGVDRGGVSNPPIHGVNRGGVSKPAGVTSTEASKPASSSSCSSGYNHCEWTRWLTLAGQSDALDVGLSMADDAMMRRFANRPVESAEYDGVLINYAQGVADHLRVITTKMTERSTDPDLVTAIRQLTGRIDMRVQVLERQRHIDLTVESTCSTSASPHSLTREEKASRKETRLLAEREERQRRKDALTKLEEVKKRSNSSDYEIERRARKEAERAEDDKRRKERKAALEREERNEKDWELHRTQQHGHTAAHQAFNEPDNRRDIRHGELHTAAELKARTHSGGQDPPDGSSGSGSSDTGSHSSLGNNSYTSTGSRARRSSHRRRRSKGGSSRSGSRSRSGSHSSRSSSSRSHSRSRRHRSRSKSPSRRKPKADIDPLKRPKHKYMWESRPIPEGRERDYTHETDLNKGVINHRWDPTIGIDANGRFMTDRVPPIPNVFLKHATRKKFPEASITTEQMGISPFDGTRAQEFIETLLTRMQEYYINPVAILMGLQEGKWMTKETGNHMKDMGRIETDAIGYKRVSWSDEHRVEKAVIGLDDLIPRIFEMFPDYTTKVVDPRTTLRKMCLLTPHVGGIAQLLNRVRAEYAKMPKDMRTNYRMIVDSMEQAISRNPHREPQQVVREYNQRKVWIASRLGINLNDVAEKDEKRIKNLIAIVQEMNREAIANKEVLVTDTDYRTNNGSKSSRPPRHEDNRGRNNDDRGKARFRDQHGKNSGIQLNVARITNGVQEMSFETQTTHEDSDSESSYISCGSCNVERNPTDRREYQFNKLFDRLKHSRDGKPPGNKRDHTMDVEYISVNLARVGVEPTEANINNELRTQVPWEDREHCSCCGYTGHACGTCSVADINGKIDKVKLAGMMKVSADRRIYAAWMHEGQLKGWPVTEYMAFIKEVDQIRSCNPDMQQTYGAQGRSNGGNGQGNGGGRGGGNYSYGNRTQHYGGGRGTSQRGNWQGNNNSYGNNTYSNNTGGGNSYSGGNNYGNSAGGQFRSNWTAKPKPWLEPGYGPKPMPGAAPTRAPDVPNPSQAPVTAPSTVLHAIRAEMEAERAPPSQRRRVRAHKFKRNDVRNDIGSQQSSSEPRQDSRHNETEQHHNSKRHRTQEQPILVHVMDAGYHDTVYELQSDDASQASWCYEKPVSNNGLTYVRVTVFPIECEDESNPACLQMEHESRGVQYDGGAGNSVISPAFAKSQGFKLRPRNVPGAVVGFNGSESRTDYYVIMGMEVEGYDIHDQLVRRAFVTQALVTPRLHTEMIIGSEVAKAHNLVVIPDESIATMFRGDDMITIPCMPYAEFQAAVREKQERESRLSRTSPENTVRLCTMNTRTPEPSAASSSSESGRSTGVAGLLARALGNIDVPEPIIRAVEFTQEQKEDRVYLTRVHKLVDKHGKESDPCIQETIRYDLIEWILSHAPEFKRDLAHGKVTQQQIRMLLMVIEGMELLAIEENEYIVNSLRVLDRLMYSDGTVVGASVMDSESKRPEIQHALKLVKTMVETAIYAHPDAQIEPIRVNTIAENVEIFDIKAKEEQEEFEESTAMLAAILATHCTDCMHEHRPDDFPEEYWRYVVDEQKPLVRARWDRFEGGRRREVIEKVLKIDVSMETRARKQEAPLFIAQNLAHLSSYEHPDVNNQPTVEGYEFKIVLEPGAQPVAARYQRFDVWETQFLHVKLKQMCDEGKMERSNSPWNARLVLVPYIDRIMKFTQKYGERAGALMQLPEFDKEVLTFYRLTTDMRAPNELTVPMIYPLPNISDIITACEGCSRYTTGDCADAFFTIRMEEESRQYTAFTTPEGHFQYRCMVQGCRNAAVFWSEMIATVFREMTDRREPIIIYQDDIGNRGKSLWQHLRVQQQILMVMQNNKMIFKTTKHHCNYKTQRILGQVLNGKGRVPDPRPWRRYVISSHQPRLKKCGPS